MNEIKTLTPNTFENSYNQDIQLQFNDDQKFIKFITALCNYGTEYQQTLINLSTVFNINNIDFSQVTPQNTYILNSIGGFLNIPTIDYFGFTTYDPYIKIIKGQQAKNAYDGTNKGLIDVLEKVFPEFQFILEDVGEMSIKIYLVPLGGVELDDTLKDLFLNGYFTPKPAGVQITYAVADKLYFSWDNSYVAGPPQLSKWDTGVWVEETSETNSSAKTITKGVL